MESKEREVLRRTCVWVLLVLFLTVGLTFCQNKAEQSFNKGAQYGAEGKFKEAKEEFEKALKVDPSYESAKRFLILIEDVNEKKIQTNIAVTFFKGATYALKGQWAEAIAEHLC